MRLRIVLAALALMSAGITAKAESITFTITDTASGSIGGQSFTNQNITVTLTGDTSNVAYLPVNYYYIAPGTTTIQIGSLGTFTLTDASRFYDNQIYPIAGISDTANSRTILGLSNPLLAPMATPPASARSPELPATPPTFSSTRPVERWTSQAPAALPPSPRRSVQSPPRRNPPALRCLEPEFSASQV